MVGPDAVAPAPGPRLNERAQLVQKHARAPMKRAAHIGQRHAVAFAIEELKTKLTLQISDRGEHCRVGPMQLCRPCLEPAR